LNIYRNKYRNKYVDSSRIIALYLYYSISPSWSTIDYNQIERTISESSKSWPDLSRVVFV